MVGKYFRFLGLKNQYPVNTTYNKQIRNSISEEQKQQILKKIKPGNSKTLWDSVKIASDKEVTIIPDQLLLNNLPIMKEERPEAFANFFKEKVENLVKHD